MKTKSILVFMLLCTMLVTAFHLCILARIVPFEITWGGRLKSVEQMYVFESISIIVNLFFALLLLRKGAFLQKPLGLKTVNVGLWVFAVLFALNTLGNLVAETNFEKGFALITGVFCVGLVWVLRSTREAR